MSRWSSLLFVGVFLAGCASAALSPVAVHVGSDGGDTLDLTVAFDLQPDLVTPPCTTNADCATSSLGNVCNTSTGLCVECVPSNDTCSTGRYCTSSNTCAVGCKTSTDCGTPDGGTAALICDQTTHECVGCDGDSDCAPGTVCTSHSCVPGCNPTHACDTGRTCCGTTCVNTSTDATNCGSCGATCDTTHSTGATCGNGICAYTGCVGNYADCTMAGADTDGCETSATTPANCGKCGACNTGGIVTSASCNVPSSGAASCSYQCTCDTSTNNTSASCNGTSCSYTCANGRIDCNAGQSADTDGCECATAATSAQGNAACCTSGACQSIHADGLGDPFYDCTALSVYNATQALEAAKAAVGVSGTASDGWTCGTTGNMGYGVCKQGTSTCACWIYNATGSIATTGHVHYNTSSNSCFCATSTDPSWK